MILPNPPFPFAVHSPVSGARRGSVSTGLE